MSVKILMNALMVHINAQSMQRVTILKVPTVVRATLDTSETDLSVDNRIGKGLKDNYRFVLLVDPVLMT